MGGPEVSALNGLVAIVTGGASGIGAAIAQRLHADGATIAVLDRDTAAAGPAFAAFTARRALINSLTSRWRSSLLNKGLEQRHSCPFTTK